MADQIMRVRLSMPAAPQAGPALAQTMVSIGAVTPATVTVNYSCLPGNQPHSYSTSEDSFSSSSSSSCVTDTDCPGGSCQFGTCSSLPPTPLSPPPPSVGTPCTSGFDCSDYICQGPNCQ